MPAEPKQFEQLVADVFRVNQFRVEDVSRARDSGGDLQVSARGTTFLVEIKYYRTAQAQAALIESACQQLAFALHQRANIQGLLVLSCQLESAIRQRLEDRSKIVIIDRADLFAWSMKDAQLHNRLIAFLAEVHVPTTGKATLTALNKRLERLFSSYEARTTPPTFENKGHQLCEELKAIECGRDNWRTYQDLCEKIVRYLFADDLCSWEPQNEVDDGLLIMDFICRINSARQFWRFLIEHLDSRYVVFEFKNYCAPIKQGQILTTEKYLLEKGLRRVAIIFTRAGSDQNAQKTVAGAMREQGKLILVLNDQDVCDMLHQRDHGNDPSDILFTKADKFLMTLPR